MESAVKSALDSIVYGSGWATTDARRRRVTLYGPYAWLMSAQERREFTPPEFGRVRRRMRPRVTDVARIAGVVVGLVVVLVLMGGVIQLAIISKGTQIGLAGLMMCALVVAGVHVVLGIPVDTGKFRRAMLLEHRCPHCAQRLDFADAQEATCAECGCVWRAEEEPRVAARPKAPEWIAVDARGQRVELFNAPALVKVAAQRLDMTPAELRRLQAESSKLTRLQRIGMACSSLIFGVQWLLNIIDNIGRHRPIGVFIFGLGVVACAIGFWGSFRLATGLEPALFTAAMLRRARCPRCGYRLEGCTPDAADGATRCPECGAAWNLPVHPPTDTA